MNWDIRDYERCANVGTTKEAFARVKSEIKLQNWRTCELVRVLQQILDKKTLNKKVKIKTNYWYGNEGFQNMTVAEALNKIDP